MYDEVTLVIKAYFQWSDDLEAPLSPIPAEWKEAKLLDRFAPELRDPEEKVCIIFSIVYFTIF